MAARPAADADDGHCQEAHTECDLKTNAQLADLAGVHTNTITQAKSVQAKAVQEVQDAVKRGDISLPKAAKRVRAE